MPDICGGLVERAYRMYLREQALLYLRACPEKDRLRRSVMRHRVRTPPIGGTSPSYEIPLTGRRVSLVRTAPYRRHVSVVRTAPYRRHVSVARNCRWHVTGGLLSSWL